MYLVASGQLVASALGGCGGETCAPDGPTDPGDQFESETLRDSLTLDDLQRAQVDLDVTAAGLPELWPAQGVLRGPFLRVLFALHYQDSVPGENVELPSVRVTALTDTVQGAEQTTPRFVSGPQFGLSVSVVECPFFGQEQTCCPFGSERCTDRVSLSFERLDGEPFPPLTIEWEAQAFTSTYDCPPSSSSLQWTLTRP